MCASVTQPACLILLVSLQPILLLPERNLLCSSICVRPSVVNVFSIQREHNSPPVHESQHPSPHSELISPDQSPLPSSELNIHWLQKPFSIQSPVQLLSHDHMAPVSLCAALLPKLSIMKKTLPAVVAIVTSHSPHLANYRVVLKGERVCVCD